jgi:hypothetical protein
MRKGKDKKEKKKERITATHTFLYGTEIVVRMHGVEIDTQLSRRKG